MVVMMKCIFDFQRTPFKVLFLSDQEVLFAIAEPDNLFDLRLQQELDLFYKAVS
jgi:hypothetical protein